MKRLAAKMRWYVAVTLRVHNLVIIKKSLIVGPIDNLSSISVVTKSQCSPLDAIVYHRLLIQYSVTSFISSRANLCLLPSLLLRVI